MPDYLRALLDKARGVKMTPEQREQQRRSFAYGNAKIENDRITKRSINREADALRAEKKHKSD